MKKSFRKILSVTLGSVLAVAGMAAVILLNIVTALLP